MNGCGQLIVVKIFDSVSFTAKRRSFSTWSRQTDGGRGAVHWTPSQRTKEISRLYSRQQDRFKLFAADFIWSRSQQPWSIELQLLFRVREFAITVAQPGPWAP